MDFQYLYQERTFCKFSFHVQIVLSLSAAELYMQYPTYHTCYINKAKKNPGILFTQLTQLFRSVN